RLVVGGLRDLISARVTIPRKYLAHSYLRINTLDAEKVAEYLSSKLGLGVSFPAVTNEPLLRTIRAMTYTGDFWAGSAGTLIRYSEIAAQGHRQVFNTKGGRAELNAELTEREMIKGLLVLVRPATKREDL
ncbi:MAG TPA: hypothetical protein VMD02_03465, partial [Candidatus Omnitrophota bacterium]|nr:hypothetical protein [Candidatus Omnitrophota bacterium]